MKSRYLGIAALAAIVVLSPVRNVEACGPWFEPDIFVDNAAPDDPAAFAKGDLGILQSGFDSNDYAVAYRYLNGGKLSDIERLAYAPPAQTATSSGSRILSPDEVYEAQQAALKAQQNAQPAQIWLTERAKYVPAIAPAEQKASFPTDYQGNIAFDESYLNCPDPAFSNATLTLTKRAETWGKSSPWLADWITAQDTVFKNCTGNSLIAPRAASSDSPALLKADRAYQTASATFYAHQFDDAARQFEAIAHDSASPWQHWGTYLAARATVRKAFAMGKATDPYSGDLASFDIDTMKHAQQMLQNLLQTHDPAPSRAIVQSELNLIRIRTEPDKRLQEICAALAGPSPDPNFSQDLRDLNWAFIKHLFATPHPHSPLLDWISAWRGSGTAAESWKTWQATHTEAWLVMSLAKAGPSDPFVPDLLSAAAKIKSGTPAYDTVFFHRVRLLIALKRSDEARALLDAAIPALRHKKPSSNLNALLSERMTVARDFNEFLTFAPRTLLKSGSAGAGDLQGQCNERAHAQNGNASCPELDQGPEFDNDAVILLNQQIPIKLLIEAAKSSTLPANLRQQIAIIAWTRAVLFEDAQSAAALSPLLPQSIRNTAGSSSGFTANLAILRNAGIRPYLEPGVPRVASYNFFDNFRDNWWCGIHESTDKQIADNGRPIVKPIRPPVPAFLTATDLADASDQYKRLQQLPASVTVIGQRVLDYAAKSPDDPLVPEALALTVRASHYACQSYTPGMDPNKSEYTPVSKAAFQLLHRRYPKSQWAAKTPYYY